MRYSIAMGDEPKDANEINTVKGDKKKEEDAIQGASSGEVTHVGVGTGDKVAPQQVMLLYYFSFLSFI